LRAKGIIELIPCIQNSPNISLPSKLNWKKKKPEV
jgi:hypothetical protein